AILVAVFREEDSVFHVCVKDGALLAKKMDDLHGIATLPEKMAEIVVGANFFADGFAKLDQRTRIIDDKIGMHFKRQTLDAMLASVLRGLFPVGDDLFLPLPVQFRSEEHTSELQSHLNLVC